MIIFTVRMLGRPLAPENR